MERLTERRKGTPYYRQCTMTCDGCTGAKCRCVSEMVKRLAEYEDTGLTPEEIIEKMGGQNGKTD